MTTRSEKKLDLTEQLLNVLIKKTRNSSGDEIANVNFIYDDIVHLSLIHISEPTRPY